jgi:hypothetical protein
MENWNIQPRSQLCSTCQALFIEKASCFTVLSIAGADFARQDLCGNCWEKSGGSLIREKVGVISYWQGVFEAPPPPPVDPLPKEDAESILRKMVERNDPLEIEARFILAVMLERKRILKQRNTQDSGKTMIYEHLKTGEVFVIADPQLKLDQLEEVQKRVAAMLKPAASQTPSNPPVAAVVS